MKLIQLEVDKFLQNKEVKMEYIKISDTEVKRTEVIETSLNKDELTKEILDLERDILDAQKRIDEINDIIKVFESTSK